MMLWLVLSILTLGCLFAIIYWFEAQFYTEEHL